MYILDKKLNIKQVFQHSFLGYVQLPFKIMVRNKHKTVDPYKFEWRYLMKHALEFFCSDVLILLSPTGYRLELQNNDLSPA